MLINSKGFLRAILIIVVILILLGGLGVFYLLGFKIAFPAQEMQLILNFGKSVSFETVSKGNSSNQEEKADYVIDSNSQWVDLWEKMSFGTTPQPELPSINFNDEIVIAVFQGSKSSTGYSVEITNIRESDDYLEVFVREDEPKQDENAGMKLTEPFHVVKIKKSEKVIQFRHY